MATDIYNRRFDIFSGPDAPEESDLYKCVHCGFCLQACPTYIETGLEAESPRGRIALMKAVNEDRIGITDTVVRHWDLCIQCRACEVACPSGVPYGSLIESTMSQIYGKRSAGLMSRFISWISLKEILPNQRRLTLLVSFLRFYQRSGLQRIARKSKVLKLLPGDVTELESSLPTLSGSFFKAKGQHFPSKVKTRAKVGLLSGCVMPLVHGPEMEAVVRVLNRNGCDVEVTSGQSCCGAINTHVGDLETARTLARKNIDAFMERGLDAIIVVSAGCGSRMKEYKHLLRNDSAYCGKAERFSSMVKDIHEFLIDLPLDPPKANLDYNVTYQDSCHLANAQRVTNQPRQILKLIPGIQFEELPGASQCCGAGGTYTVTEREFSLRILDNKMANVLATGASVVATANPGCLMQLQYGSKRERADLKVKYVTDLLDEAYELE